MNRKLAGSKHVLQLFEQLWQCRIKNYLEYASNIATAEDSNSEQGFLEELIHVVCTTIPLTEHLNLCPDVKRPERALAFRTKGTQMYHPKVHNYLAAIKYFNASITHTELNSSDRGIAYANRSIVCMELERYQDCLENIRLARASNYPVRFLPKLAARQALAEYALRHANTARTEESTNGGHSARERTKYNCPNRKASQAVTINSNERLEKLHQHMYEQAVVGYEDLYKRCNFCHSYRMFTLIPCEGCTVAMYCSVECLTEAYEKYHRYECGLVGDLWKVGGIWTVTAFRRVAVAIASFKDVPSFVEYLELFAALPACCSGGDGPAVCGESRNQTLSFRIFLATIMHGLMIERTVLGWSVTVDNRIQKLLFHMILYHLNCSIDH